MNHTVRLSLGIILALLCSAGALHAQRPQRGGMGDGPRGAVSGTVIDSTTGEPLPVATVALWSPKDSTLVTGALAEKNGSFTINGIRPGRYYARISFIGYTTRIIDNVEVTADAPSVALGNVLLSPDALMQSDVVVTARREFMTVGIDRTAYKVDDILVASGGSATDVLRNIPTIEVDMDGNVSLRGNQNVVILINGRPSIMSGASLAGFLQSLPANSIERVEVIPNPSAKYDPDGMSGIINIVLKQESDRGLSGGINGALGTSHRYNISGNLNYGQGPWSLSSNYGFNYSDHESSGWRIRENRLTTPFTILQQTNSYDSRRRSHFLSASAEYAFDPINSLSFSTHLNTRSGESDGVTSYTERDINDVGLGRYDRGSSSSDDDLGGEARLSYKWLKEAARNELNAEVRFEMDGDEADAAYDQQRFTLDGTQMLGGPELQRTQDNDRTRELTGQIDYMVPLGAAGRFETGYKGEMERISADFFSESFDSSASAYFPDVSLNNAFHYDRTIHAVYAIYGHSFGDVSAQVGVRAEQAITTFNLTTTGEAFDKDYFSLFPSAFVNYKPTDALQLRASYSKRISRPRIHWLNPFSDYNDPSFRRAGNPYLDPEYTHAFELSAIHFTDNTTLTLNPYFRRSVDVIRRYERFDSSGVSTMRFENLDEMSTYGADVIGSLRFGEQFNASLSFSAYRIQTDGSNIEAGLSNDAVTWSARGDATYELFAGLSVQGSFFYRPEIPIEGGKMGSQSHGDLAIQQRFLDNRARLGVRVNDLFNSSGFSVERSSATYAQQTSHTWGSRTVQLTFSYTFGNNDRNGRRGRGNQDQPMGEPDGGMGY